jgi:DNA-binding transcriptional ArsR family regulator
VTRVQVDDPQSSERIAELFKALSDPTRVRIIAELARAEACVHDLAATLGLTPSAVSHQLRLLRHMHVVRPRRDGRHVFYRLDDTHVRDLYLLAHEHLHHD